MLYHSRCRFWFFFGYILLSQILISLEWLLVEMATGFFCEKHSTLQSHHAFQMKLIHSIFQITIPQVFQHSIVLLLLWQLGLELVIIAKWTLLFRHFNWSWVWVTFQHNKTLLLWCFITTVRWVFKCYLNVPLKYSFHSLFITQLFDGRKLTMILLVQDLNVLIYQQLLQQMLMNCQEVELHK